VPIQSQGLEGVDTLAPQGKKGDLEDECLRGIPDYAAGDILEPSNFNGSRGQKNEMA